MKPKNAYLSQKKDKRFFGNDKPYNVSDRIEV